MFTDTCVILAAGKGTRMGGIIPKVLLPVEDDKPVIQYVIDFWKKHGIEKFIFVVGYKAWMLTDYIENRSGLKSWKTVVQYEQKGIVDAILKVEPFTPDRFIVALGDCVNIGSFPHIPETMRFGCGVWYDDYRKNMNLSYSVQINSRNEPLKIIEKPAVEYCGMGTYFFHRDIFSILKDMNIEITEILDVLRERGLLNPVKFEGTFINCTTPEDISRLRRIVNENSRYTASIK